MIRIIKRAILMLVIVMIFSTSSYAKRYITEPLLVPESPYAGMTFYIYKPYDMPKGWYITLDGYPVRKNPDGMWVYGTYDGVELAPTNYVVGSIVPSMAGIIKWVNDVQISELRKLPNPEIQEVRQKSFTRSQMAQGKKYSTYIPAWTYNSAFMAVGKWKKSVDRLAVISELGVPAAWMGANPRLIYLWTGSSWYQLDTGDLHSAKKAIARNYTKIRKFIRDSDFTWYAQDTPVLAQQSRAWGYYWLGEINITK